MSSHTHTHNHGHVQHHHVHALPTHDGKLGKIFYWAIGLNLAYVLLEAGFGFATGSMGLLSDAGHNLSDVASLLIALLAFKASRRPVDSKFTYGYGRATVEASLLNAVILYAAVIFIIVESVGRLLHPAHVDGLEIAWVAGVGVIVNGVTAWLLLSRSHDDLNVKGAFMHMAADTLVSVGVVGSGLVINYTGWSWLDPVVGILIAIIIAVGSRSLLRDSLRLSLDGVPSNIDVAAIKAAIGAVPEVRSFHHLHVWALSTTQNALTVHVIVEDPARIDSAIEGVKTAVSLLGISHVTIQAETMPHDCGASGLDPS